MREYGQETPFSGSAPMSSKRPPDTAPAPIRAAEYLRMSTEMQVYSPLNQSAAIHAFADAHGMVLVRTYLDKGRSGLDVAGRPALQQLLEDVRTGQTDFDVVLVYDVSRWGRFQNSDEAGYHEFLCLRAGIRVHYVAEPFDNDGSALAAILKNLKRTMAGEYSRELSLKVFTGQCRLAKLGFHQGGMAGYGLRRMLVGANGEHKMVLGIGERKSLVTERVILVPGPRGELKVVRRIFAEYARGLSYGLIAKGLNADGIRTHKNKPWRYDTVSRLLANEKYLGHAIYAKSSKKLKEKQSGNPANEWARHDGAYTAVVSKAVFEAARPRATLRMLGQTDDQLLEPLRQIFKREGTINQPLIDKEPGCFCSRLYAERFGGLRGLYARLGYTPARDLGYVEIRSKISGWRESLTMFAARMMEDDGSMVERSGWALTVDHAWSVSFSVLQSSRYRQAQLWMINRKPEPTDIVVFSRMPADGTRPIDHLVMPRVLFPAWPEAVYRKNGPLLEACIFPSLAILADLARTSRMESALCS